MLVYHPAHDAYHCVFRLLSILEIERSLEADYLRLLDFILCFPSVIADFRFTPSHAALKKLARGSSSIYRSPLNTKSMFLNLRPAHEGALACLAAAGFIVSEELQHGHVIRTAHSLPAVLASRCAAFQKSEAVFFNQLMKTLLSFPLHGESGLKDRSGLMEYRYDHV